MENSGPWEKKFLSTRVLCWGVKENLYRTGHEDLETWELCYPERLRKNKRHFGASYLIFSNVL
jgi:hypothetical protein